jgi:hypothetical protein
VRSNVNEGMSGSCGCYELKMLMMVRGKKPFGTELRQLYILFSLLEVKNALHHVTRLNLIELSCCMRLGRKRVTQLIEL